MPLRFDPDPNPEQPHEESKVDLSKRYDVYCMRYGNAMEVYRNVRFRRARSLLGKGDHFDMLAQVIELEQANGQSVFITRHGIIRFCEHGTELSVEVLPAQ